MRNAFRYYGEWLCKGSDAYALYEACHSGEPKARAEAKKKLDSHMKLLDQQFRALHGLPQKEKQ